MRISIIILLFAILASCAKKEYVPINYINTEKYSFGTIQYLSIVKRLEIEKYGEFEIDKYNYSFRGARMKGKNYKNDSIYISLIPMNFLWTRSKCFYARINGFEFYMIDDKKIESNMSQEQIIEILGPPDYFGESESEDKTEITLDYYTEINHRLGKIMWVLSIEIEYIDSNHYVKALSFTGILDS